MMPRFWLLLFIVFLMGHGNSHAQSAGWEIPITVRAEEDLESTSATVIVGARPDATDGYDGPQLEPITPSSPFDGALIRSTHSTSEFGYPHLSSMGGMVDFNKDYRALFFPGQDKIWRLKVGYYGILPHATLQLTWPGLQSLPANLVFRIGRESEFVDNPDGGIDMRAQSQFRMSITVGTYTFIEMRVRNIASASPFISLTPKSANVPMGGRLPITAWVQNVTSIEWGVTPNAPLQGLSETRREFVAPNIPGIYTVRATARNASGQTATDTATIHVIAVPILYGDLNLNDEIDVNDVYEAYRYFIGVKIPSVNALLIGDARPQPGLSGRRIGDGEISADDLNWIFRRFLGIEENIN